MTSDSARIALVTGANKGIGLEAARHLAMAGIHVLIGSRDAARGIQAVARLQGEGLEAEAVQLSIDDDASVASVAAEVDARFGRLDILVNNAAFGLVPTPPSLLEQSVLRAVFETNFYGAFRMIQSFLPLLRRSAAGRIVNVTSGLSSMFAKANPQSGIFENPFAAYSISKVALNALTVQFAAELHATPIKVNAVDPGFTRTDMTRDVPMPGASPEDASAVIARYALIDASGPSGGLFNAQGPLPW